MDLGKKKKKKVFFKSLNYLLKGNRVNLQTGCYIAERLGMLLIVETA